jgi:hypothetical protein
MWRSGAPQRRGAQGAQRAPMHITRCYVLLCHGYDFFHQPHHRVESPPRGAQWPHDRETRPTFLNRPSGGRLRRVALGGYPPKAPTDPHERISRMRFFKP